jgi:hypothetical protein
MRCCSRIHICLSVVWNSLFLISYILFLLVKYPRRLLDARVLFGDRIVNGIL